MYKIKNKTFKDFLEVYTYMIQTQDESYIKYFPDHRHMKIKFLLEEKFNRKFSLAEIKELLKDISLRLPEEDVPLPATTEEVSLMEPNLQKEYRHSKTFILAARAYPKIIPKKKSLKDQC